METVNVHRCLELFEGADQMSSIVLQNFDLLEDEMSYGDYDLITVRNQEDSSDDEEVIDVETIDEPEDPTCRSARTIPFTQRTNKTIPASAADTQMMTMPSAMPTTRQPGRTRLSSEQLINEMIALTNDIPSDMLESSLDPSALTAIEEENFALLGLDIIEADDLESLFMQFEGVTGEIVTEPPQPALPSPKKVQKPKPRPLSLEEYRKMRARNSTPCSVTSSPSKNKPTAQKPPTTADTTPVNRSMSLPMPVTIAAVPQAAPSQTTPATAAPATLPPTDHDYCSLSSQAKSTSCSGSSSNEQKKARPQKQDSGTGAGERNYKKELISLLNRIPQYLSHKTEASLPSQGSTAAAQPCTASHPVSSNRSATLKEGYSTDKPSCQQSTNSKPQPSTKSLHCESLSLSSVPLSKPRRKRKYRRRRSPLNESSDSAHSKSSDLSSSCESCSSSSSDELRSRGRRFSRSVSCRSQNNNRSSSRSSVRRHQPRLKKRQRHRSGRSSQSVSPHSGSSGSDRSRSRSSSQSAAEAELRKQQAQQAHAEAMRDRRVVYVGGIGNKYTKADLRKRFGGFGDIERVSIHTRESGENYGFVTFFSKADAYAAIEKGNDVYGPKFNIGFGGRRMFCDTEYADLDGCQAVKEEWAPSMRRNKSAEDDFDALLKRSIKKMKS